MAGGAQNDDDEVISAINITPLVDVTLVLLIIFMVTATVIISHSIPVDLPEASTGEEVTSTVVVYIDESGTLHLDGQPTTEERLLDTLRKARQADEAVRAIISADRRVRHGRFVKAVDLVRRAGIARFAVDVQARGEEDEGEPGDGG